MNGWQRYKTAAGVVLAAVMVDAVVSVAFAQQAAGEYRPWERNILPNVSDYGGVGALQTPTARFGKDGQFLAGISIASPYHRYFINLQALPWLEGTFRYTRITDRAYSNVPGFSEQDYKDRSVDLKIRLGKETENWPEIAIGARDLGGTNLFGSEYITASKRFGDFDVTAGLGFGALGSRAHIENPLGQVFDRFKNRGDGADAIGGVGTAFFTGPMALFGSISYRWEDIPLINDDLTFIVEYDPNNYKDDPASSDLTPKTPFNVGVSYQPSSWIQLSAGFERGDTAMARVSLFADFNNGFNPLLNKGIPPEVAIRGRDGPQGQSNAATAEPRPVEAAWLPELAEASVRAAAADRGMEVRRFDVAGAQSEIDLVGGMPGQEMNDALAVASQAARAVPATVETVEVRLLGPSGRSIISWKLPREGIAAEYAAINTRMGDGRDAAEQAPGVLHVKHVQTRQDQNEIAQRLFAVAAENDVVLDRMEISGDTVRIYIGNMPFRNFVTSAGRAARVATQVMPPEVERLTLILGDDGLAVAELTVLRSHLERLSQDQSTIDELWHQLDIRQAAPAGDDAIVNSERFPAFDWSIAPRLRQQIGGPDNFFLYQVYLRALASVRPTPNTEIDGYVGLNIVNNYDELTLESDSQLPRVRSDIKEYLKQGETWIGRLQGAYYGTAAPGLYMTAYAGLLEEMFGGVGGEVLYKSIGSPWAFGLDVNWVKQRDFDGMLGFRDYSTVTGHLGAYYDLPFWDLHGSVRAGRYLAKDWGATFELAREFESGIRAGVFATVTDVSADEFGEGSFDKGFFLSVPLDLYATKPTKTRFGITYRPVTRDGGQQLNRSSALIGRVDSYDANGVARNWPGLMD